MTTTKSSESLSKHTLHLREGDFTFLRDRFPRLGASKIVRRIVSKFVDGIDRPVDPDQLQELTADEESNQ